MPALNGTGWIVLAAAFILCALLILFVCYHRYKRPRHYNQLSFQLEKQNKDFIFSDAIDDGIIAVRVIQPINAGEESQEEIFAPASQTQNTWPKTISLFIKAKSHECFYGYDLMQVILNQGFVHGTMNFFHFINGSKTLFSIAPTEGEFNLEKMGAFKTSGLCIFMQPQRFQQPILIFDQMLDTAQHIAEELGGTLEDEQHHLITSERLNYWRSTISDNPNE
ncbi:MAG: zipA [Gammaproteobacteria bacterium]|jgi:FtsZ-interacting cell division protein ZipA|nr:zipA [Gammaproteobacteria bacterium]